MYQTISAYSSILPVYVSSLIAEDGILLTFNQNLLSGPVLYLCLSLHHLVGHAEGIQSIFAE